MVVNLNYVKWIQEKKITLYCENKKRFLKSIGAKRRFFDRKIWDIHCKDEGALCRSLQALNDDGFMFSGGSGGWNPVDVFIFMREKSLVSGKVVEIVWIAKGKTVTRVL